MADIRGDYMNSKRARNVNHDYRSRVAELKRAEYLEEQKKNSVSGITEYERYVFENSLDKDVASEGLKDLYDKGTEKIKTFDRLVQDIYSGLYQRSPKLNKKDDMYKSFQPNAEMMEMIMQHPAMLEARKHTRHNKANSIELTEKIGQILFEIMEQFADQINDQFESEFGDGNDSDDESDGDGKGQQKKQGANGKKDSENDGEGNDQNPSDGGKSLKEAIEKISDEMITKALGKMSKAMNSFSEEKEMEENSMISFGTEKGELAATDLETKQKIAANIKKSPMLQKVVEQVGRLKDIAKAIRVAKTNNNFEEVIGMKQGNNISHLLPQEMMGIDEEELEVQFFKKMMENSLMQYEGQGREDLGKGPIVFLVDCSGSMQGEREQWAKGVMLAMQMIAKQDKRDLYVCYFNNGIYASHELGRGSAKNVDEWMNFVALGANGGTSFMGPIDHAINYVKNNRKFKSADIVVISDGECDISETWLKNYKEEKEKLDFNTVGVLIGDTPAVMNQFCDKVFSINDLRKADKNSDAMKGLFTV